MTTRVLVLGSSGRIGTLLRRSWALSDGAVAQPETEFVFQTRHATAEHTQDILWDPLQEPSSSVVTAGPFDCLIVLSGIVPKPSADFTLNTTIAIASITAAARLGIGQVLLASTSAVYGNYSDSPFAENAPLKPVNDYGRSKLEMEQAAQAHAHASGVGLCCLRIGNVAGADALLCNGAALAPGETLTLDYFCDGGTPERSYIGPKSLACVFRSLVAQRNSLPAALNIATPPPVTMRALAEAAQMPLVLVRANEEGHQHITLDCDALEALHQFAAEETAPAEMVRQWKDLRQ